MPNQIFYARLAKSEAKIRATLDGFGKRVFSYQEIQQLFDKYRQDWGMPDSISENRLIERFLQNGILRIAKINLVTSSSIKDIRKVELYLYKDPTVYEIATGIAPRAYLSHFPAMFLSGLTSQIPKTLYVTQEQSVKRGAGEGLSQDRIDYAFSLPQRRSETIGVYEDWNLVLLKGKNTHQTGVVIREYGGGRLAMTALERTLLDITVRPNYAGGAFMVLDAYRRALQDDISINKLMATLEANAYIYPYQQAIGFYLSKAGYTGKFLDDLLKLRSDFNFYLDYQMEEKEFDATWRIYYPRGM